MKKSLPATVVPFLLALTPSLPGQVPGCAASYYHEVSNYAVCQDQFVLPLVNQMEVGPGFIVGETQAASGPYVQAFAEWNEGLGQYVIASGLPEFSAPYNTYLFRELNPAQFATVSDPSDPGMDYGYGYMMGEDVVPDIEYDETFGTGPTTSFIDNGPGTATRPRDPFGSNENGGDMFSGSFTQNGGYNDFYGQDDEEYDEDDPFDLGEFGSLPETTDEEMRTTLRNQGWTEEEIDRYLDGESWTDIHPEEASSTQPAPTPEPNPELEQAKEELATAQRFHTQTLQGLQQSHAEATQSLAYWNRELDKFKANLKTHQDDAGWLWYVTPDDRRENFLEEKIDEAEDKIRYYQGVVTNYNTAIRTNTAQFAERERELELAVTKADEAATEAEIERRTQLAVEQQQQINNKALQMVASQEEFAAQIAALDAMIEGAKENGLDQVAEQFEKDKQNVIETRDRWLNSLGNSLAHRRNDLTTTFADNRRDGLGPTSITDLFNTLEANGEDADEVLNERDPEVAARARQSSYDLAQGAIGWVDPHEYTWRDFAYDYSDEFYVTFGSWDTFSSRYGAYLGGVGRAGRDAVVDIYNLGTAAYEATMEHRAGEAIVDFSNWASEVTWEDAQDAAGNIIQFADRRFSRQAAIGDVEAALGDTGYVVGTIVGIEEAGVRIVTAGGTKFIRFAEGVKAARLGLKTGTVVRVAKTGETAVDLATDATRASRAGNVAVDTGRAAETAGDAGLAGSRTRRAANTGEDLVDAGTGVTPSPYRDRTVEVTTSGGETPDMILEWDDGFRYVVSHDGEFIAKGTFTSAYSIKGYPDRILLVTKPGDNAAMLDDVGAAALDGMDPDIVRVPQVHHKYRIEGGELDGGVVTVSERAPNSWVNTGNAIKDPFDSTFTPGQAEAFKNFTDALNDRGYAWVDNHGGNFTMERVPGGGADEWRIVILDTGGIIPMKSPESARGLQNAIDGSGAVKYGQGVAGPFDQTRDLARQYDSEIDWDTINQNLPEGETPLSTLDAYAGEGSLPMNPETGRKNPRLNELSDAPPDQRAGITDRQRSEFANANPTHASQQPASAPEVAGNAPGGAAPPQGFNAEGVTPRPGQQPGGAQGVDDVGTMRLPGQQGGAGFAGGTRVDPGQTTFDPNATVLDPNATIMVPGGATVIIPGGATPINPTPGITSVPGPNAGAFDVTRQWSLPGAEPGAAGAIDRTILLGDNATPTVILDSPSTPGAISNPLGDVDEVTILIPAPQATPGVVPQRTPSPAPGIRGQMNQRVIEFDAQSAETPAFLEPRQFGYVPETASEEFAAAAGF